MSAEEDSYFATLRIDRVQAKLAMAEAIVTLARQGRVEHRTDLEALARAFNLMPPSFGVGGGHHDGHAAMHGDGEEHAGGAHGDHPHPHPHPHTHSGPEHSHPHGPAQSDADGIGLATLIARASAEMAEAGTGLAKASRQPAGGGGRRPAEARARPLVSRVGLLTSEGATQIRLAVLKAKIALAEAVAVASQRAGEPDVCAWILSLATAFDELPAPIIIVAETESDE